MATHTQTQTHTLTHTHRPTGGATGYTTPARGGGGRYCVVGYVLGMAPEG